MDHQVQLTEIPVNKTVSAEDRPQPLSHTKDPVTSYAAADKLVKSGKINRQENRVLQAIKIYVRHLGYKDFTARELAKATSKESAKGTSTWLDYFVIQRRLSGLRNKGRIERTGERRNGCMVWRIK